MSRFNTKIIYARGSENHIADCLSCYYKKEEGDSTSDEEIKTITIEGECQDADRTPGRNSGNSEFARTWDFASAYVLRPCCSSGPRGRKR